MGLVKRTFWAFLCVIIQTGVVRAQDWQLQGIGNDVFQAHYSFGSGRFSVHCGYQRYFEIALLRQGLNGRVTFTFDGRVNDTLEFSRSGFSAGPIKGTREEQRLNGSTDEKKFYRILSLLRRSETVSIVGFGFNSGTIQLEGAKEILAFCRETDPVTMFPKAGPWKGLR